MKSCANWAGCVISTCKTTGSHSHMIENGTSWIHEFSTYSPLLRCRSSSDLRFILAFSRPIGECESVRRILVVQTVDISHLLRVLWSYHLVQVCIGFKDRIWWKLEVARLQILILHFIDPPFLIRCDHRHVSVDLRIPVLCTLIFFDDILLPVETSIELFDLLCCVLSHGGIEFVERCPRCLQSVSGLFCFLLLERDFLPKMSRTLSFCQDTNFDVVDRDLFRLYFVLVTEYLRLVWVDSQTPSFNMTMMTVTHSNEVSTQCRRCPKDSNGEVVTSVKILLKLTKSCTTRRWLDLTWLDLAWLDLTHSIRSSHEVKTLPYGLEWGDRSLIKKAQLNLWDPAQSEQVVWSIPVKRHGVTHTWLKMDPLEFTNWARILNRYNVGFQVTCVSSIRFTILEVWIKACVALFLSDS